MSPEINPLDGGWAGDHPMVVSFLDADPFPQVRALVALNTVVWPHTDDPRDYGTARCVRIYADGLGWTQFNLPTSSGLLSMTLPFTDENPKTVFIYASTNAASPDSSVINDTKYEAVVTPGELIGPEVPSSPLAKVQPERPHFAWPFTRPDAGGVYVVEQGSPDHIRGQQYALVVTPLGWRSERPEYGWPWPEFSMVPLDLEPLRLALRRFVPDADVVVEEWADVASEAIRHIRFDDPNPNRVV